MYCKYSKFYIVVVFIVFSLSSKAFCNNLQKVSLQLDWKYQFEFAGFIMAKEKGFFKQNGLDVTIKELKNPKASVINDVLQNRADFGMTSSILIYEAAKGKPVIAIMPILQHTPAILVALKSNGILKLKDLNQKSIFLPDKYVFIRSMLKVNHIKYKQVSKNYDINSFSKGHVDAIIVYSSNGLYRLKEKGIDVSVFNPANYGFDGYDDILFTTKDFANSHPKTVRRMANAILYGWRYAFEHIDETVNIIYHKYNSLNKSKNALYYEANEIMALSGYNLGMFGKISLAKVKNIAGIYTYIMPGIYNINGLNDFIFGKRALTNKEIKYLVSKKILRVCVYGNQYPVEAIRNGKYMGMMADIIKNIGKQLPVPMKIIKIKDDDSIKDILNKKCDIKSVMLDKYSQFSPIMKVVPLIYDNFIIITRTDKPFIEDLYYLSDKRLAVRAESVYKYLKDKYPFLNIDIVFNTKKAFTMMKKGNIYGVVVSSAIANSLIKMYGYKEFKVNSKIGNHAVDIGPGILRKEPILYGIMQKLIGNINQSTIESIKEKYNAQVYETVVNYRYLEVVIILFSFLLIILFSISLFYRLKSKQLKMLLNSSIEGVVVIENDKIVDANVNALKIVGFNNIREIIGRHVLRFIPDSEINKIKNYMKSKKTYMYESYYKRKDGSIFPVLAKGTTIASNKRIVSFIDLTELKETQKKLEILNTTLEKRVRKEVEKNRKQQLMLIRQNRLAQTSEVMSMIAHQWRQPLNILSLIIQKVVLEYKISHKLDYDSIKMLEKETNKQIKHMSSIIDDFKNFFKPEKNMTVFDVSQSVKHAVSIIKPILDKNGISLFLNIEDGIFSEGFPNEFGQSVINIVNNAKDALIESPTEKKKIIVRVSKEKNNTIIEIEDTAGGVNNKIKNMIFDPYFSTKSKEGTGLGLYMAKIIIEEHMNGSINVYDKNKGALFKIVLRNINRY